MCNFMLLEFKLDNLSFDMDDSLRLDIQFESGVESISGLYSSF